MTVRKHLYTAYTAQWLIDLYATKLANHKQKTATEQRKN